MPLERALLLRRSVRSFEPRSLTTQDIGQLAWAAQGITNPATGARTAPSAGALFPIEVHFVTAEGASRYLPAHHALLRRSTADLRGKLTTQETVHRAPCVVVLTSVTERTRRKYGDRAERYVAIEAGHIGQNILLQAVALGLAGTPVGAFDDESVRTVLGLDQGEEPVYMLVLGAPAAG